MARIKLVYAAKEPERASLLIGFLEKSGFSVTKVRRAKEAFRLLDEGYADVLMIGPQLADSEGLIFMRTVQPMECARNTGLVALLEHPVQLTGPEPDGPSGNGGVSQDAKVLSRLAFFESGADECLFFDQDLRECLARIKAVFRRVSLSPADDVVESGAIEINLTSYTAKVNGRRLALTAKEFDLLFVFLSSPDRVLSRPYLIERVWGYNYFGSPRTVDVHVRRLRKKLGKEGGCIKTVPCVGYKLDAPE